MYFKTKSCKLFSLMFNLYNVYTLRFANDSLCYSYLKQKYLQLRKSFKNILLFELCFKVIDKKNLNIK